MICQKKNKRLLVFCLSFLLFCLAVIPCLFSVESYASETTTESVEDYFRTHNFYDTCAYVCRKYASFPYVDYLTGSSSGITYDAFADYMESKGLGNLLQEDVTITGTGGGRGYDIPQDVRQEMLNFVSEIYIDTQTINYTECLIQSYNNLNPNQFNSYSRYKALKDFISQQDGYCFVCCPNTNIPRGDDIYIAVVDKANCGFFGTVSNGSFTNVQFTISWMTGNSANNQIPNSKRYVQHGNGTIENTTALFGMNSLKNTTSVSTNSTYSNVFTNLSSNELVFVFNTLDAYKNYNAGNPRPYYMPTNSQTYVPYYDGFTESDLNAAGQFYNNIVINTSGDNPTDTKKKTDSILGSLDGIFGGSDSESSSGGLFDSLGDIITGATGAISPIKEIVLGDIKELVADVFDFLPPTIITLWVSGIIFGIFFGVLKLIRG